MLMPRCISTKDGKETPARRARHNFSNSLNTSMSDHGDKVVVGGNCRAQRREANPTRGGQPSQRIGNYPGPRCSTADPERANLHARRGTTAKPTSRIGKSPGESTHIYPSTVTEVDLHLWR